jgi:hypothetical protein
MGTGLMFNIITARDFYAMLVEDFDDFVAEPHSVRRALHCAISAYHMYDWVWADWLKEDRQLRSTLGIGSKKSDFADWLRQRSPWFQMVEAVANGTKHLGAGGDFETVLVLPESMMPSQIADAPDQPALWGGPVRYVSGSLPVGQDNKGYLLFDLGEEAEEHRFMPVAHVLEAVVRLWRDFMRKHRPSADIPVSRHHVD